MILLSVVGSWLWKLLGYTNSGKILFIVKSPWEWCHLPAGFHPWQPALCWSSVWWRSDSPNGDHILPNDTNTLDTVSSKHSKRHWWTVNKSTYTQHKCLLPKPFYWRYCNLINRSQETREKRYKISQHFTERRFTAEFAQNWKTSVCEVYINCVR